MYRPVASMLQHTARMKVDVSVGYLLWCVVAVTCLAKVVTDPKWYHVCWPRLTAKCSYLCPNNKLSWCWQPARCI